ncbi:hypothetical protein HY68_13425 [Streptomyces sp. AcH 505]|nr:hypothetical protein HY68_13425 [Streptomyces sp. AcH 505]
MRPIAPRRMDSITMGFAQRRPERAPVSTATESASRPAWAVRWSRCSRSARTSSSACRFSISRRSASMPVASACIRPAALELTETAAARLAALFAASSKARRTSASPLRVSSFAARVSAANWSARAASDSLCSRSCRAVHRAWAATVTAAVSATAAAAEPQASGVRTDAGAAETAHRHRRAQTAADISRAGAVGRSEGRKSATS